MADDVTGVVTTGQQLATGRPALVLRTVAGPGTSGLATGAALYAGLVTGRAGSSMAGLAALVNTTAEAPATPTATPPGC